MRARWQTWILLSLFALAARGGSLDFRDLPKPVQRTINRHLDGGAVQSISHVVQGAQLLFAVTIRQGMGPLRVLHVTMDGQLIDAGRTGIVSTAANFE